MLDKLLQVVRSTVPADTVVVDDTRPTEIRFKIPKNHPKLDSFLCLARSLATYSELSSGIIVEKASIKSKDIVEKEILGALVDLVGMDVLKDSIEHLYDEPMSKHRLTVADYLESIQKEITS